MSLALTDIQVADKRREFDRLAPFYDLLARLGSLGTVGRIYATVARLAGGGEHAIDLCCGTGGVTRALARLFGRVTGVDLSPRMLARAERRQPDGARLVQGDLLRVPLEPADAVTCAFGLHELPPLARGGLFHRAASLLRPGGRLVVCDYRRPPGRLWRLLARLLRPYVERQHFLGFLDEDLVALAAGAGLVLVEERRLLAGTVQILAFERDGGGWRSVSWCVTDAP